MNMTIETKKALALLLGFRPKESKDFNDGIAGLISEIARYQTEISAAETELAAHRDKLNQLIEGDLNITQSTLDQFAAAEARIKQNIKVSKRRMKNREERLRTLEEAKKQLVHDEEKEQLKFNAQQATLGFAQFVTRMKEACAAYQVGKESMLKAERRATAVGVPSDFMLPVENRAVTFGMHELYKIFGSHSYRIRMQSAPSSLRNVDHVQHLAELLVWQLRGNGNGNDRGLGEDGGETNLALQETESENQNREGDTP